MDSQTWRQASLQGILTHPRTGLRSKLTAPSPPLMRNMVASGSESKTSAPPSHHDVLYLPLDGGNENLGISLHPVLLHLKHSAPEQSNHC